MFRMLRLKPPNGWGAVAWELAIVTAGVLIALAFQQWADGRSVAERSKRAREAIREEMRQHYLWAYEFRVVAPCVLAQINRLQSRVMSSASTLDPAPRIDTDLSVVVRLPSKDYSSYAYDAALSDSLIAGFDPAVRTTLGEHYGQVQSLAAITRQNDSSYQQLDVMNQPIPLDPSVRYALLEKLAQFRGQVEFMDLIAGQLLDYVRRLREEAPAADARRITTSYGTYKYCSANKLPMRSFKEALVPVPG